MSEFAFQNLLITPTVTVRDVYCQGSFRQLDAEEHTTATQLVFPYRGAYVRHVGRDEAVAGVTVTGVRSIFYIMEISDLT
jgi:AraC family transcriptional regulator